MEAKLKLNVEKIENKKFSNVPRGYDALEVDRFLDIVIQDYLLLEQGKLVNKKELDDALATIEKLKKEISDLTLEKSKLEAKLPKTKNGNVTPENIKLLERISALERYIYKNGGNPKSIK